MPWYPTARKPFLLEKGLLDPASVWTASDCDEFAQVVAVLAHSSRVRMIHALAAEGVPLPGVRLMELLRMEQTSVSSTIRHLRSGGFVDVRREGNTAYNSLVPERFVTLATVLMPPTP